MFQNFNFIEKILDPRSWDPGPQGLVSDGAFYLLVSIDLVSLVLSKFDMQQILKNMTQTQLCGV